MQIEKHEWKYVLILDFEATCLNQQNILPCNQIIEFPVIVLNTDTNLFQQFYFHKYIKPTLNPQLSPFCTQLTGITQQMVNKGISLQKALDMFELFLEEHKLVNFIFLTVGEWDLSKCLRLQCFHKKIQRKDYYLHYINIKRNFPPAISQKVYGMKHMLQVLQLELLGRHHSGIDDCRNTGRIVQKLIQKGFLLNKKMCSKTNIKKK